MMLLPFQTFEINSSLSLEEVIMRLADNIEPEKGFMNFNRSTSRPFEGQLRPDGFSIKRIISYRNSFQPVITGRVESMQSGTRIVMRFRLHIVVIIFLFFWFGIHGVILISAPALESDNIATSSLGMMLFAYFLTMGGYWFESYKARETLRKIFAR